MFRVCESLSLAPPVRAKQMERLQMICRVPSESLTGQVTSQKQQYAVAIHRNTYVEL